MLLGSLAASLLPSFLGGKGLKRAWKGIKTGVIRAGQGIKRKGEKWLSKLEPLTNFQIMKYYKHNKKFNGVFPKDELPKKKPGGYIINLGDSNTLRSHWVATFDNFYFDSFGVDPKYKNTRTR